MSTNCIDEPFFSVVTVVKNDEAGLRRTQNSVAMQDGVEFEWIVIDGGSRDETLNVLRNTPPSTKWISEVDEGIYDGMNKGLKLARGRYVVFMNAGDEFSGSGTLAAVEEIIVKQPEWPDLVFGAAVLEFGNGILWTRPVRRNPDYIYHGLPALHQATFFKTSTAVRFPYRSSMKICGDYGAIAEMMRAATAVAFTDEVLCRFNIGGASLKYPFTAVREAAWIQRHLLGVSLYGRIASAARRVLNILCVKILKNEILGKIYGRHEARIEGR